MKRGFLLRNEASARRLPRSGAAQSAPGTASAPHSARSGASQPAVGTDPATLQSIPGVAGWPGGFTQDVSLIGDGVRWIGDARVDSQAMLSAYLWFKSDLFCQTPGHTMLCNRDFGPLPLVVHKSLLSGNAVAAPGTFEIPCTDTSCLRCSSLQGGYQFRWFHHAWLEKYRELARPGAWPGPSGGDVLQLTAGADGGPALGGDVGHDATGNPLCETIVRMQPKSAHCWHCPSHLFGSRASSYCTGCSAIICPAHRDSQTGLCVGTEKRGVVSCKRRSEEPGWLELSDAKMNRLVASHPPFR